jgi:uncharacterized protein (DUF697 family)
MASAPPPAGPAQPNEPSFSDPKKDKPAEKAPDASPPGVTPETPRQAPADPSEAAAEAPAAKAADGSGEKEKPAEPAAASAAEAPKAPEKPQILCRKKARTIIHRFAVAGTAFSALPIPVGTSAGLTALETYLVYFIGKVYGEELSYAETMMVASGLNVASVALKTLVREGVGLIPVIGWGIRAAVAALAIEGFGEAAIRHFEKKHPNKTTNA